MLCVRNRHFGDLAPVTNVENRDGITYLTYEAIYRDENNTFSSSLETLAAAGVELVDLREWHIVLHNPNSCYADVAICFIADFDEYEKVAKEVNRVQKHNGAVPVNADTIRHLVEKTLGHLCYVHCEVVDQFIAES